MNVLLMHAARDFDPQAELPPREADLRCDLGLDTLLGAMAGGDPFLLEVARRALLTGLRDPDEIAYRQHVLADCLDHPSVVRDLYAVAVEAIAGERKVFFGLFRDSPDAIRRRSVQVLEIFLTALRRLRSIADEQADAFRSEGFVRFFSMLAKELDDGYLETVERHLHELTFPRGVLISAQLGKGNKGVGYVLRRSRDDPGWLRRVAGQARSGYSFQVPDRDESGLKALSELEARGLNDVAGALAQSVDHILGFFRMLRVELAFYVACLNLHERLADKGEPTCFPVPLPDREQVLSARGLYDVGLSLHLETRAVGNDLDADERRLVMITGANQGGKSTFLRAVGLAQLMMQAGMFVGATAFRAAVRDGVFTHHKREEDPTMESGKLDEELRRMRDIVEVIRPGALLLCNESFASTNEREGSEIARQVVLGLVEAGVTVFFVTHLFDLAERLAHEGMDGALFLRAERREDGTRTFRLVPARPLPTSFGQDLYTRILGDRAPRPL